MHSQRSIHPQFPQGYPQIHRRKRPQNRGCAECYPHCPQVIHNVRPHGGWLWKPLWIAVNASERLFTHVAKRHKYTCSCMFGTKILLQLVISKAGKDKGENVSLLRKCESPKKPRLLSGRRGLCPNMQRILRDSCAGCRVITVPYW